MDNGSLHCIVAKEEEFIKKKCDRKNIITGPGMTNIALAYGDTLNYERS